VSRGELVRGDSDRLEEGGLLLGKKGRIAGWDVRSLQVPKVSHTKRYSNQLFS
jgi:hypothetical protein